MKSPKYATSKVCQDRYTKDFSLSNPLYLSTNLGTGNLARQSLTAEPSLLDFVPTLCQMCYPGVYNEPLPLGYTHIEVYVLYYANVPYMVTYDPYPVTTLYLPGVRSAARKKHQPGAVPGSLYSRRQDCKFLHDLLHTQFSGLYDGRVGKIQFANTPVIYVVHCRFVNEKRPPRKSLLEELNALYSEVTAKAALKRVSLLVIAGIVHGGILLGGIALAPVLA